MLYALATPVALVGLLLGFLAGVVTHGCVQASLAAVLGDRGPAAQGRRRLDPRAQIDPFGAVAAALAGVGFGKPVPLDRRRLGSRARFVVVLLSGGLANLLLGLAAVVGFLLLGGPGQVLAGSSPLSALHGFKGLPVGQTLLLAFGISNVALAILSVVPLPPLDGARVMFAFAPRTSGWQRAEYLLVEQNVGLVAVLVLLVLPLAGQLPLLLVLLNLVVAPLLTLFSGLG
ncbi:MAG: hypothetical protein M3Z02_01150 [Actinomycetota bacterium]|nr:hypothetical protein [Actinomycetota bacterium]